MTDSRYTKNVHKFVIRKKEEPLADTTNNIFVGITNQDSFDLDQFDNIKKYSVAGDSSFIQKFISKHKKQKANENISNQQRMNKTCDQLKHSFQQFDPHQKLLNTTTRNNKFNSNLLSKVSKHQKNYLTKERRNIQNFQKQTVIWQRSKSQYSKISQQRKKALIESTNKKVLPLPNQKQIDNINEHIVHYWEMSLRNNHKKLLKHFQGAPIGKIQFEQLLQTRNGKKKIESMVPQLNTEILKDVESEEFIIKAKSKAEKQFNSTFGKSFTSQKAYPQYIDQVYKAEWNKTDLSRKNAHLLPKLLMK